jgi:hypothetical protein
MTEINLFAGQQSDVAAALSTLSHVIAMLFDLFFRRTQVNDRSLQSLSRLNLIHGPSTVLQSMWSA